MASKPFRLFLCRKEVADMAEIDSLEIKIQSDAEKASQAIDKLVKKLDSVAKSLGSINTSAMSANINELAGKLSAINGKGFSGLNKSAKEAETTIKKVSDTAKRGIKSKISFDTKDYQTVIDNLNKKFANTGNGFKAGDTFVQMQKQADTLSVRLDKLLQKEDKIVSVGKMSPESSVFQNLQYDINTTMNNLDLLYIKMGQLSQKTKDLSNIKIHRWNEDQGAEAPTQPKTVKIPARSMGYNKEAVAGVEAIYQKMYGDAEKASQKTDSLGNRVEALKEKLKELSGQGLNFGDAKFDETYKKLNKANEELKKHKSNLEQTGNSGKSFSERMRNALSNVSSQTSRTSGNMGKLSSSIKKALHSVKQSSDGFGGFAKKIGFLYAKLYVLRRGFNALFGTIKSSMDYIETLNYFNAAFEQIAKKADLKSFKEMGYDSAEAYYNSFSERAEKLTQKMSGFKIDESGMAVSTGEKSLGIDPGLLMQNQAMFGQMSNSMSIASETAGKLSSVFTRLGADIASLKNEDFQKVWQNMASGMTGMSRAVDKYGMNIREANLQQTLANIGIDKSISKLTQQEKVLLRTIVMLDSSRAAWGDLAKTMNQPANQLRLLQSNWSNLSRTIGNIFLPVVAKVLPYLNAVTIVLQRFAEQIVKLLGFEDFDWGGLGATGGADFDIDFGDAEDDTAGMADNMDKTAKKAKKAVDNLQGFDIINKLQDPNEGKDSSKDEEKGLSGAEMGKLTGALDKLFGEYDKVWKQAFKDMENKANELANKMQKVLVNAWNKGDFSELGKKVAAWINKGLAKIPWESIKKTVKKIARSIATFLNGFIAELDWVLVGKTFAEGLNTIIEGGYEFWTTFDWLTFGTSLATGVNSFIDNFDAEKFGKLLGAKLRGVIQFAFGFITNLNFEELGEKIGNAINGFFEDMGEVRKNTGLTGWQELGQTISKSITGILDTINTALSTVKWEEVGKALADFLINIDWWGILGKLLTVLGNTLSALVKTAISAIAENPAGVIKALTGAFALIFTVKKLMSGMGFLTNTFKSLIGSGITGGINKIPNSSIKRGIASKFGSLGSIVVSLEVLATSVSFAQSAWKDVFDKYDTTEIYKAGKEMEKAGNVLGEAAVGWGAILGGGFSFEEWGNGIKEWWEDQWSKDTDVKNIDQSVEEVKKRISEFGKRYNPVTGKTTRDSKGYKKEKKEYLKNLEKEKPELYKKYMEYEKQEKALNESTKKLSATFKSFGNDTKTASSRINSLKEEVRRGNISLSAYKKLISGTYKSNKNWTESLRDARLATKYTNGDLDKFNEKGRTLSKTLEKSGVETGKAKNAVSLLKDKLNEGKISFSDYEKICSKSYETTGDLYSTLDKIKKLGKISPEIRAKIEGKQEVDDLGNEIKTIKDKNVTITANADTTDAKYKINDLITGKKVTITASLGNTKELTEKIKNALKATPFKMTAAQIFPNKEQIAEYFKKITESKAWKNVMTFTPTPGKQVQVDDKNKSVKIPKDADFGGVLSRPYAAMGYKINYYAVGGFPNQGQLFVANEKGPELVGKMNGRTAVAPQNDIAEGFAQAITNTLAPVMYSAFKQAATETAQISGGDVYLDGMKVTDNIIGHINQISQSRGRSPIWGVN